MKTPKIPENEADRIKELYSYDILDTVSDDEFDELTALASEVCNTPISMVSLVDSKRQWFKSKQGTDTKETPRDIAFCAHAINEPDSIFEIENAKEDQRFFDNPLVTGDAKVGFYAGVSLVSKKGHALGTLCVVDNKPNKLNDKQKNALKVLAKQTMNLIELRKTNKELTTANQKLAEQKREVENFAYHAAHDLKSPLNNIQGFVNLLKDGNSSGLSEQQIKILDIIESSTNQLKNLISDLLALSKTENLSNIEKTSIDLELFISEITSLLEGGKDCVIDIKNDVTELKANESALKAIFHNLLSNSIKYSDKEQTVVHISVTEDEDCYYFTFKDNGPGINSKNMDAVFQPFKVFTNKDKFGNKGTGLGLTQVKKIINNLKGTIQLQSELGKGVQFNFSIKK